MKTYYWSAFSLLLILSGCGKKESSDNNIVVSPPITANGNFLQKVEAAAYFCGEAGCPQSTVAVAVNNLDNENPTWCTGTVLKDGRVITAKSCFSAFFFDTNNRCSETVLIKTLSGKVLGCSEFIAVSPELNESVKDPASRISDYVILNIPELADFNFYRPIAMTPLEDQAKVSVWYLHQLEPDKNELSLEVKKCFNQRGSLISPWNKESQTSHLFFSRCDLPMSAQGSAILNKENHMIGLVHSISQEEDLDIWSKRVLAGETLQNYALANSLLCTSLNPSPDTELCNQKNYTDNQLDNKRAEMFTNIDNMDYWQTQINDFATQSVDKYLSWTAVFKFDNAHLLYKVDFIPKCFMRPEKWLQDFRTGLFNMFYSKESSIYKSWPAYKLYSGLNADFILKTDLFDDGELLYQMKFSPRNLHKNSKSNIVTLELPGQRHIADLQNVPTCQ